MGRVFHGAEFHGIKFMGFNDNHGAVSVNRWIQCVNMSLLYFNPLSVFWNLIDVADYGSQLIVWNLDLNWFKKNPWAFQSKLIAIL